MKHGLITFGNEESYGLLFVGGELVKHDQRIRFFDGANGAFDKVRSWEPDYVMFSPMTTFYPQALRMAESIKGHDPSIRCVFGGHHAMACPDIINEKAIDTVVIGPVRGAVQRLLNNERIIRTRPTKPDDLPVPARNQYYKDIPRMGKRYRKFMLSMLGCPWNCSYCSSSSGHIQDIFSPQIHRDYFLKRRSIPDVIAEAKQILEYDTHEIEWVDDDIFAGKDADKWLLEFADAWSKDIGTKSFMVDPYDAPDQEHWYPMPMYVSTTSHYAMEISDDVLKSLRRFVNVIGMGVQAIRPESLKLFNRSWDCENKMRLAYDRLTSFGYRVNLQAIVGLPIADPVEEAIETLLGLQRIGPGSICSVYPLMVYPGTELQKHCQENQIGLNADSNGDTNSAIGSIYFDKKTWKRLRNICKFATMFVKYGVDERWMRTLIDVDLDEETSKQLSITRYYDCVVDRLPVRGKYLFDKILKSMKMRY